MQLQVSTSEVKDARVKLKNAIKKYGENNSSILYEVGKLNNCWVGKDAQSFLSNIESDRRAARDIINYLNNLDTICEKVISSYDNFK